MRTRILRLTVTAGVTALLFGAGALATAGTASAATARTAAVATDHHSSLDGDCGCYAEVPETYAVWDEDRDYRDYDHDRSIDLDLDLSLGLNIG